MATKKTTNKKRPRKNEPTAHGKSMMEIAKRASQDAVRESKAKGLDIVYMEDNIIYREKADGSRVKIKGKTKW